MAAFERASLYIKRLGFWRGVGLSLHKLIGKLLNPYVRYCWGSLAEDELLLWHLQEVLEIRKPGYYVDVGCAHPISHSNTWRLYQMGWSGLCIDANPDFIKKFKITRPRDQAVHALVSREEKQLDFTIFKGEGAFVSSVNPEHVASWRGTAKIDHVAPMTARTLQSLLEEYRSPADFELLKIDVEDHDEDVILSIDITRYKPKIILVETHAASVKDVIEGTITKYLESNGYVCRSVAGYNSLFTREAGI